MKITVNSIFLKYNFSLIKLIYLSIYNRLTSEHVNKLLFIYINNKILNRVFSNCLDDDEELETVEELEEDDLVTVKNS